MVIKFVQTSGTKFRVREETCASFVHPSKGEVPAGLGSQAEGEDHAFLFATDPPNSVEHYDDLILELLERFQGALVVVFELPGFALSASTSKTVTQVVNDLVEFVEKVKHGLQRRTVGLVMPCVSGIFVPVIMARLPVGTIDFVSVPQCGNYACEHAWADTMNSTGLLSLSYLSRAFNYFRKKSIAKGWYKAALPPRGSYDDITADGMATKEACSYVRQRFTDIAFDNFDNGGSYPLAYFLQALFYSPYAADAKLLDEIKNGNTTISVPTLALWGLQDGTHAKSLGDETVMASYHQFVEPKLFQLRTIQESAHFPELQCPKKFVGALTGFLQDYDLLQPSNESKL